MKLDLLQIDAFAERPFTGNPAAVVPLNAWLPDDLMQAIALENNLSETAFFVPSSRDDADYDLRWCTPSREVDLCGHATLASAHALFEHLGFKRDRVRFSTRSGVLTVQRRDGLLWLDMPALPSTSVPVTDEMKSALGVRPIEAHDGMYLALVLASDTDVRTAAPDIRRIAALHDHAIAITARGESFDFVSRLFAPNYAIDEDPVTGSLHAQLTPLWARKLDRTSLSAHQASPRGGNLLCELNDDRVTVGGSAVTYLQGTIELHDA